MSAESQGPFVSIDRLEAVVESHAVLLNRFISCVLWLEQFATVATKASQLAPDIATAAADLERFARERRQELEPMAAACAEHRQMIADAKALYAKTSAAGVAFSGTVTH